MATGVLTLGLLAGCVSPDGDADGHGDGEAGRTGEAGPDTGPSVRVDGEALVLAGAAAGEVTVAVLDGPDDGTPLHASVRPGGHDEVTVLALARIDDPPRYELRYLTVRDGEPTDLYWFPWRLQVDDGLAGVDDTPPIPVWSPDGSTLAWIEWDEDTTRLRTVGWRSDATVSNPTDDTHEFELDGVPPGVQLDAWDAGDDGRPRLTATSGDRRWEIRVDRRAGLAVAMPLRDGQE